MNIDKTVFAQLTYRESLRDIDACLRVAKTKLYHMGIRGKISRNTLMDRFPEDFMFQLTKEEFENLRFHFGTSRWGGRRYLPFAFTQEGVAMLSSVLKSKRAVQVNIEDSSWQAKRNLLNQGRIFYSRLQTPLQAAGNALDMFFNSSSRP